MPLVQRIQQRILNICLRPRQEWDVIAGETSSTADLLKNYALPLVGIGAIAIFIGLSFVGISAGPFAQYRVPLGAGLAAAVVEFVREIASAFILAVIINELAPKFGGEKNSAQSLKVAIYSSTPAWAAAVLWILPALGALVSLVSLYGIYLLYLGLPRLMKPSHEKSVNYVVIVVACGIGIRIVTGLVSEVIVGAGFGAAPPGLR
jgi:hypothetical protein